MIRLLLAALIASVSVAASAADGPAPSEKPGPRKSGFYDFWNLPDQFTSGVGSIPASSCTARVADQPSIYAGNLLLDCNGEFPHNETTIAVDPNNSNHAIGGFHSYLISFNGATVVSRIVGSSSATFDGGQTWHHVMPPITPYQFTGDPALAFDARGRVYFANIADHEGPGGNFTGPSVVVQTSLDGGLSWWNPVTVARGSTAITAGKTKGPNVFNDKDFLAVDTSATSRFRNRAYVTWSKFTEFFSPTKALFRIPIMVSFSDDGQTWSAPSEISGFSPFCNAALFGQPNECDLNQDSYPAVAPGGKVYVSFENFNTVGLNQALVVSSNDGGATWSNPSQVDFLFDLNFPQNVDGRDTLTGCQLRYGVKANTAADPSDRTGKTVYVAWADNRNGSKAATNTDVFLGRSTDGGLSWKVVSVDDAANDQFYTWVSVASDGRVDVGYMDRSYSAGQSECKYGFSLTRLTFGGTGNVLSKTKARVDTGLSDLRQSRWFAAGPDRNSRFIGDYNGIAVDPASGATWSLWTDQRALIPSTTLHGQHAVGTRTPR